MKKENFILVSLDDPNSNKIAKVLSNKTSKRILEYLEENPKKSQQDISKELKIQLNTLEYNLKQLLEAKLIEKSTKFFWSQKGKRISLYEVSNKSIIFSTKKSKILSELKSIFFVSTVAGIFSMIVRMKHTTIEVSKEYFLRTTTNFVEEKTAQVAMDSISQMATQTPNTISLGSPLWWFFGGFILTTVIFILIKGILKFENSYKGIEMKGGEKYGI